MREPRPGTLRDSPLFASERSKSACVAPHHGEADPERCRCAMLTAVASRTNLAVRQLAARFSVRPSGAANTCLTRSLPSPTSTTYELHHGDIA